AGDETVIHYTSSHWLSPRQVRRTAMTKFAKGDEVYVRDYSRFYEKLQRGDLVDQTSQGLNQLMDSLRGLYVGALDFSVEAVMERAENRLGEFAFDIVFNNCEHFTTWCKTGISSSEQITDLWRQALTGGGLVKSGLGSKHTSKAEGDIAEIPWRLLK
ncbi:MAG: lecithin retinol acyltransferase family protein, partial [Porticoccus sp.]|nr:lecithin retinol acyltransferase family protein [Porticoccus sp.]